MKSSFKIFMQGLIDYAGLFPPAKLDLGSALENYARHLGQERAWMLGRFVVPANLLAEVAGFQKKLLQKNGPPLPLAVILSAEKEELVPLAALRAQVHLAATAQEGGLRVEAIEMRMPPSIVKADSPAAWAAFLLSLKAAVKEEGLRGVDLFLEAAGPAILSGAKGLASFNKACAEPETIKRAGLKLRLGGTEASAFPEPQKVAEALAACLENAVPFKCTAGLHHPLRSRSADPPVMQHGFINVFGAALLDLSAEEIDNCLRDEEPKSFRFDENRFEWKSHTASLDELRHRRGALALSFGSCSFEEPLQDLEALGWLF